MKKTLIKITFIVCLFQIINLHSQTSIPKQRHHAVVLVDRSASMANSICPEYLAAFIKKNLKQVLFEKGYILPNQKLLDVEDYLSVLSFGLKGDASNFEQFIPGDFGYKMRAVKSNNQEKSLDDLVTQLNNINCYNFANKNYGVYTVAIPAVLNLLKKENKKVNRTFVITITDRQFNAVGQQPRLELETTRKDIDGKRKIKLDVERSIALCTDFLESYSLIKGTLENYQKTVPEKIDTKVNGNVFMGIYEVVPNQRPFAIESFLRTDRSVLQFNKSSLWNSDFCTADLNILYNSSKNLQNLYHIDSVSAILSRSDSIIWHQSHSSVDADISMKINIPVTYVDNSLKFDLKYWVSFTDNSYGLHILSPDGHELQGAEGLKRSLNTDPKIKEDRTWMFYVAILGVALIGALFFYLSRRTINIR